jgi:hypothetical protein
MYCFGETGIDPAQAELSASFAKVPKQLLEFSSRLSRACLGKLIAFSCENSCVLNAVSAGLSARHARNAYSAGHPDILSGAAHREADHAALNRRRHLQCANRKTKLTHTKQAIVGKGKEKKRKKKQNEKKKDSTPYLNLVDLLRQA